MNTPLLVALAVVHLAALADIWTSRLSTTGRVLWSLMLVFLPVAGVLAWALTRGSAHGPLEDLPTVAEEEAAADRGLASGP